MTPELLREIFGPECAVAVRPVDGSGGPLPSAEAEAVARAVPKRRHEFMAGRSAARAALQQLGFAEAIIPVGPGRAPVWPPGVIGSIAHAHGWAVAVAARSGNVRALGLDLEPEDAVGEDVWERLFRPPEIARLTALPAAGRRRQATIAFCAKEAFYKLQYPLTSDWYDFAEAEVSFGSTDGVLEVGIERPVVVDSVPLRSFPGKFLVRAGFVIVGLHLPAPRSFASGGR